MGATECRVPGELPVHLAGPVGFDDRYQYRQRQHHRLDRPTAGDESPNHCQADLVGWQSDLDRNERHSLRNVPCTGQHEHIDSLVELDSGYEWIIRWQWELFGDFPGDRQPAAILFRGAALGCLNLK